jgi:hypothetical protein
VVNSDKIHGFTRRSDSKDMGCCPAGESSIGEIASHAAKICPRIGPIVSEVQAGPVLYLERMTYPEVEGLATRTDRPCYPSARRKPTAHTSR